MEFKFSADALVITSGIRELMERSEKLAEKVSDCFVRHHCGDWGDLCEEDINTNEEALKNGERLFSSYEIHEDGEIITIWIITEWDRSVTTILLPEEY